MWRKSLVFSLCGLLAGPMPSSASGPSRPAPSTPAFLRTQALAGAAVAEEVHPISPTSRVRFLISLTRRDLIRLGAVGAAAAVALPAMEKPGVGEIRDQVIRFQPFQKQFLNDLDVREALEQVSAYVSLIKKAREHVARGSWSAKEAIEFGDARSQIAIALLGIPHLIAARDEQLARNGRRWSDTPEERINQLLYTAVPAFLAKYGLLVEWDLPFAKTSAEFGQPYFKNLWMESLSVSMIATVSASSIVDSGQRVSAPVLGCVGLLPYKGLPLASDEETELGGVTVYDNVVLLESGLKQAAAANKQADARQDPKLLSWTKAVWEVVIKDARFQSLFSSDPLEFSRTKLSAEVLTASQTDKDRESGLRDLTTSHELQHVADARRGLFRSAAETPTWAAYLSGVYKPFIARENRAHLRELTRMNVPEVKRQLAYMIAATNREASNIPRVERLVYFNLLNDLIAEIASHSARYPRIVMVPGISARVNAAGQLYKLTPQDFATAVDAILARPADAGRILTPATIDRKDLTRDASAPRTPAPPKIPAKPLGAAA